MPDIRDISEFRPFFQSKGYRRMPITKDWLEETISLRAGLITTENNPGKFRRLILGLNILFDGLKEELGQERLHQFVRALEALILPSPGETKKKFVHRCQTFNLANDKTRSCLKEAYDMRSDTEHMNPWDRRMQRYPINQREDTCWHRTRQIEQLACVTYSRLLLDPVLREHFKTDETIKAFWNKKDHESQALWGVPIDITLEPLEPDFLS